MADRCPVEILSGDDFDPSPHPPPAKKRRSAAEPFLIVDDDDDDDGIGGGSTSFQTTPSVVPDTPFSNSSPATSSFVKCTFQEPSGKSGFICLDSDNELEEGKCGLIKGVATSRGYGLSDVLENPESECGGDENVTEKLQLDLTNRTILEEKSQLQDNKSGSSSPSNVAYIVHEDCLGESKHQSLVETVEESSVELPDRHAETSMLMDVLHDDTIKVKMQTNRRRSNKEEKKLKSNLITSKQLLKEEKRRKREQEKLQKEAMKAETMRQKKLQKEQQKWEKGKFALKSIVADIDSKVVETGSIGGHLLTRFAEKSLTYRISSNDIGRSVRWKMNIPEHISEFSSLRSDVILLFWVAHTLVEHSYKFSSLRSDVPYILLVYAAEEFCDLVHNDSLTHEISAIQRKYPSYTVCCLTNRLLAYINKREQNQYKNPANLNGWKRPPIEEALAKLTTHFFRVHSRHCIDEAEVAEHIVGLTCSLASCQFRKNLTQLSVNANGSFIPKDFVDKNLVKRNMWLKALVCIPKVQPRFAVAIWKKYPTMRSLLEVYMDPNKSVHEKEFLLKDLITDGQLGQEERRVGEICSKRVYRILMAQSGNLITDDIEDGADHFNF